MSSNMIRITGMNSGLDTESIISAYTSTAKKRVTDAKNKKTLNEWTQTAWQGMNSKIYSFYSNTLTTNRMSSAYAKTKVTTSNGALSVVAGGKAVNGVQTAKIKGTASAAYLTSSKINISKGSDNLASTLGIEEGKKLTFTDANGTKNIQIGGESDDPDTKVVNTMDDLVKAFKDFGINANFDEGNKRLFLSAKTTGKDYDFDISGDLDALSRLGLQTREQGAIGGDAATKINASNAVLELNGAEFESNTNTFNINGSTYSINYMPSDPDENISVTTSTDYDGIYNVVKDMLKQYNELVNEMSKQYNAASAKGYDPLTDEQKEAMSEKEIEDWENKIKDSLLRNDDTLYGVMSALTEASYKGFEVGGKTMYLSDFGISTMGYFEAEANERYALHIDGNSEDSYSAGKEDKLKAMIAADPEKVMEFFTQLSQEMYKGLNEKMGSSSMSSIYKVYNDKQLKSEATDWDKKIADLEKKVTDIEDRYYQKFAQMEKLLSTINSKSAAMGFNNMN